MINEENSLGALTRTYIGRTLAHIEGTNPATGTARYYFHDNLGSSRSVRNTDKSLYASFEHTPYGEIYASTGAASSIDRRFTGHTWDSTAEVYYAFNRCYIPTVGRWLTRDPFGMVDGPNVYAYVAANPVTFLDLMALARLTYDEVMDLVDLNNCSGQSNEMIVCIIWKESRFDPHAKNKNSTATGLMQVTKRAAKDVGAEDCDMKDPAVNIQTGSKYLKLRIHRAKGDVTKGLEGYGTGKGYADDILKCEKCLKELPEGGDVMSCLPGR